MIVAFFHFISFTQQMLPPVATGPKHRLSETHLALLTSPSPAVGERHFVDFTGLEWSWHLRNLLKVCLLLSKGPVRER